MNTKSFITVSVIKRVQGCEPGPTKEQPQKTKQVGKGVNSSCNVCGDKATKYRYSHYGTTSCFSCRAFFRRTIQKRNHELFYCGKSDCVISVQTRKKCQYCRFQKCLRVGMTFRDTPCEKEMSGCSNSPAHLMSGCSNSPSQLDCSNPEENAEERNQSLQNSPFLKPTIEEEDSPEDQTSKSCVQLVHQSDTSSFTSTTNLAIDQLNISSPDDQQSQNISDFEAECKIPKSPNDVLTADDIDRIDMLKKLDRSTQLNMDSIPRETLDSIISLLYSAENGSSLDYRVILWGYTFAIEKITYFARGLVEFDSCSSMDKRELLYQNTDPIFNIKSALFFVSKSESFSEQMEKFSVFAIPTEDEQPPPDMAPIAWHQFFQTPWATNLEHEQKYENLMKYAAELNLQHDSGCILQVIALFATDGVSLENITEVQTIQKRYIMLLYRYLVNREGPENAEEMHSKYIQMLKYLREMANIMKNETLKL